MGEGMTNLHVICLFHGFETHVLVTLCRTRGSLWNANGEGQVMARATVASLHSFLKCAVIHSRLSTNARRYHINIVVTLRILI